MLNIAHTYQGITIVTGRILVYRIGKVSLDCSEIYVDKFVCLSSFRSSFPTDRVFELLITTLSLFLSLVIHGIRWKCSEKTPLIILNTRWTACSSISKYCESVRQEEEGENLLRTWKSYIGSDQSRPQEALIARYRMMAVVEVTL